MNRCLSAAFALAALAACGREPPSALPAPSAPAANTAGQAPTVALPARPTAVLVPLLPQLPRCAEPRFAEAVRAFERGAFARARELWLSLPVGLDVGLLGARLHAAESDDIGAVRALEALRGAFPQQGRVWATAAEIHAAAGRLRSAEDEIREGLALAGPLPDLVRARGVLALCRQGGARAGLEHLLAARQAEPQLEFCDRPLAQAHILLGNAALASQNALDAVGHARAALVAQPGEHDAQQLLADALAAGGDFKGALELYETLLTEGVDVRGALSLLALRGATAALLEGQRPLAVARYLRGRELGITDEELGFGATVLGEEATRAIDAGLLAYEGGDLEAARASFADALRYTPRSIEAHNHLAVVLFKQSAYSGAAEHWRTVLELAQRTHVALPEPVHLNLARALHQGGAFDEVRGVLAEYLARSPDGEFAEATRAMLTRLDAEALARDGAPAAGR